MFGWPGLLRNYVVVGGIHIMSTIRTAIMGWAQRALMLFFISIVAVIGTYIILLYTAAAVCEQHQSPSYCYEAKAD